MQILPFAFTYLLFNLFFWAISMCFISLSNQYHMDMKQVKKVELSCRESNFSVYLILMKLSPLSALLHTTLVAVVCVQMMTAMVRIRIILVHSGETALNVIDSLRENRLLPNFQTATTSISLQRVAKRLLQRVTRQPKVARLWAARPKSKR